jgi:F-type H+-transporting ATPase subunit beta
MRRSRGLGDVYKRQLDDVAEGDFYMKGGIDEVLASSKKA